MQVFVREPFTMIAAPVQCDVDGIPKGSHCISVSTIKVRLRSFLINGHGRPVAPDESHGGKVENTYQNTYLNPYFPRCLKAPAEATLGCVTGHHQKESEMQARLSLVRFPSLFVAIVFAVATAILLGGVLGYTLKPAVVTPGRTQVIVVPQSANPTYAPCVWVNQKKAC